MGKQMLIDATQPEESRVAILNQNHLEEFDFETTTKKQLKGNIYLAKVIRIEPSLQAAFVEFGGNRHGFLAFNEIHPDYYRIPIEDRQALLAQEAELAIDVEETEMEETSSGEVEVLGGEDVEEIQVRPRRSQSARKYKIQEVIKRRQIMLVQVVKEERGGKGAALTTYLSLAGRYCVLMPNAARGGGISRKITSASDRKRLREIVESLDLPDGMSLIIRTAGMARTKVEIKRDCAYLMQLWNDIRDTTLHSIAPQLIYEESNLIKRAIRDYYTRDVDEVWIEGDAGYKEARQFIQKLVPSHAKKVKQYKDDKIPLFYRYGVEQQIDAMHNPISQLKSGGYIVFGTTEALVAIDVNSGKATRERHIEETAFKTNLEAAEEVARQLRLRDLAGLVVIDFIDMDDNRNIEAVERRLKDAMQHDRARVQVGRISPFGLLELSRQRLRPNIIESTSLPCQICKGSGMIRSVESSSLHVLRAIEEEAIEQKVSEINVFVPTTIALYILNQKRKSLEALEDRWDISVSFSQDDTLTPPDYRIERSRLRRQAEKDTSGKFIRKRSQELPSDQEKTIRTGRKQSRRSPQQHDKRSASPAAQQTQTSQIEQKEPMQTQSDLESAALTTSNQPPTQPANVQEKPPRQKQRRRYRKFERKPKAVNEPTQTSSQAGTKTSSPPKGEILPASSISKEKKDSKEGEEKKKTAKTASESSEEPKKTATRKGWWKKLIE